MPRKSTNGKETDVGCKRATAPRGNLAEVEGRIEALGAFGNHIAEAAKELDPHSFWSAVEAALEGLRADDDDDEEDDNSLVARSAPRCWNFRGALERLEAEAKAEAAK